MALLFLAKSLFTANQQITDIAKNTEVGAESAYKYKQNIALTAGAVNELRVDTLTLMKASAALNDELGLAVQYDMDRLVHLAKILDANVLNNKQAVAYNKLANNKWLANKTPNKTSYDYLLTIPCYDEYDYICRDTREEIIE